MSELEGRGKVKQYFEDKSYGFIQPNSELPQGFARKDIYFRAQGERNLRNAEVDYLLHNRSQAKPSAFKVWLVSTEDGSLDRRKLLNDGKERNPVPHEHGAGNANWRRAEPHQRPNDAKGNVQDDDPGRNIPPRYMNAKGNPRSPGQQYPEKPKQKYAADNHIESSERSPSQRTRTGTVTAQEGEICTIKSHVALPQDYPNTRTVTCMNSNILSGYLTLKSGDKVEFLLGRKEKHKPRAYNVQLVGTPIRSTEEWETYIGELLQVVKGNGQAQDHLDVSERPVPDLVLNTLSSHSVWEGIGQAIHISSSTMRLLLELILQYAGWAKPFATQFNQALKSIATSKLLRPSFGPLWKFTCDAMKENCGTSTSLIKQFLLLLAEHVPEAACLITSLVKPLIRSDNAESVSFLYDLLKRMARKGTSSMEALPWEELPLIAMMKDMHLSCSPDPMSKTRVYCSWEEYFGTYFLLVREELHRNLLASIRDFQNGKRDEVFEARLSGLSLSGGLSLACHLSQKSTNPSFSPPIGQLLCISVDGSFEDIIWATVRSTALLQSQKEILIQLSSETNTLTDAEAISLLSEPTFKMLLSESGNCSYMPILKALRAPSMSNLCFKNEILQLEHSSPPEYLRADATVQRNLPCQLNDNQKAAVEYALKNRLAIIQGAPATGKTHVAATLAWLLSSIPTFPNTPILVVCKRDSTLHQLMDKICQAKTDLYRVNDQEGMHALYNKTRAKEMFEALKRGIEHMYTKNPIEEPKSLRKALYDCKAMSAFRVACFINHLSRPSLDSFIKGCDYSKLKDQSRIAEVKRDPRPMSSDEKEKKLHILVSAALEIWLPSSYRAETDKLTRSQQQSQEIPPRVAKTPLKPVGLRADAVQEDVQSAWDELATHRSMISPDFFLYIDQIDRDSPPRDASCKYQHPSDTTSSSLCFTPESVEDLWELNESERLYLVHYMTSLDSESAKKVLADTLETSVVSQVNILERYERYRTDALQYANIIGMTFDMANRHRHYIEQVKPAAVIVEEADTITEAQLLAILGDWVKHMVLMGDQRILHHAKKPIQSLLDVSLMERLIMHRYPKELLLEQNRMRPELAELMLDIYPELRSNMALTDGIQALNCIGKSAFFWNVDGPKTTMHGTNAVGAARAAHLALFLIKQGYSPRAITLLADSLGQSKLIKQKLGEACRKNKELIAQYLNPADEWTRIDTDIHVSTIDMYQGEENDIVIVSLVGANGHDPLTTRCVAQTRARSGLYFIGSKASLLQHPSWKGLVSELDRRQCVGKAIPLHCPNHPNEPTVRVEGVETIPLGSFCKAVCGSLMPCGKHKCRLTCGDPHKHQCTEEVEFGFTKCGHKSKKLCFQEEASMVCDQVCQQVLDCGKHRCEEECKNDHTHAKCQKVIQYSHALCGHPATRSCYEDEAKDCRRICVTPFKSCGHKVHQFCCERTSKCPEPCPRILSCGHKCTLTCGEKCPSQSCICCQKIEEALVLKRSAEQDQSKRYIQQELERNLRQLERTAVGVAIEELRCDGDTAAIYQEIVDRLKMYVHPGEEYTPVVKKIETITNNQLEMQFMQAKLMLKDQQKRSELKFHDTDFAHFEDKDAQTMEEIISQGFVIPMTAGRYGQGLYFASDSSKAARPMAEECDQADSTEEAQDIPYGYRQTSTMPTPPVPMAPAYQQYMHAAHATQQNVYPPVFAPLQPIAYASLPPVPQPLKGLSYLFAERRSAVAAAAAARAAAPAASTQAQEFYSGRGDTSVRSKRLMELFGVPSLNMSYTGRSAFQSKDPEGLNKILLCEVLVGKSRMAERDHAHLTSEQLTQQGYDSVFAKRGISNSEGVAYDEFVVYKPEQAMPRYIIHYAKKVIETVKPTIRTINHLEHEAKRSRKYAKYVIQPKRHMDTTDPLDVHFRIVESQFLRLLTLSNVTYTIKTVEYHVNPALVERFEAKEADFQRKYGKGEESQFVLAFHGTRQDSNIDSIVKENFRLDLIRRTAHGHGIYFSEFPAVSIGYGNIGKLLLCKVLPGRCSDQRLQSGFDSHRVQKDPEGRGQMLVIAEPDQILPCYVVHYEQRQ